MKYYILIFFLLFLSFSQSQNGEITYKVTVPNPEHRNDYQKKHDAELDLMSFTLIYDKEKSFYKKNKSLPIDELTSKIAAIFVSGNIEHYQLYNSKNSMYISEVKGVPYKVLDTTKRNSWTLSKESKKIDNYSCYKATIQKFNNRSQTYTTITAWYAPEIAVPYGPIGYGGLPGLILQLEYINGYIISTDEIVLNKKKIKVPDLPNIKKISKKQYLLLRRKARKVTED